MNVVITISSDSENDEDCSDVEFVDSFNVSAVKPESTSAVRVEVQNAIDPSVLIEERSSQIHPEVKFHQGQTDFNRNTLKKEAKHKKNVPKRGLKHDISNKLDLHIHKSLKQNPGMLKPNLEVLSFLFKPVLNYRIPKKRSCLETGVTEGIHSGKSASLSLTEDATQRSLCPGEPHSAHADKLDNASLSVHIAPSLTHASSPTDIQEEPSSACDHAQNGTNVSSCGVEDGTDVESNKFDHLSQSIPSDSPLSIQRSEAFDGFRSDGDEAERDSPSYFMLFQEENGESNADVEFNRDERHFVCPRACQRIMDGLANTMIQEENVSGEKTEVKFQQRLRLVYIAMEENYQEGTLQIFSELIHPGYCPPKNVMAHLINGILLDPLCPPHRCVQAWNLLMRTQRHHLVDKSAVPWNWEMLSAVMSTQDEKKKHRPEVVRMLLEYVVKTLDDDFSYKKSTSELHLSIARATLSCSQCFIQVQDVIKWLFSAIIKSTENGKSSEDARDKDEHIKMVSILQRMLCLALEVDCSPALSAPKLSQEIFFTLLTIKPLRAHRQLLLDSLPSNLLRLKLLEHLLDYACPLKTSAPMSLSLLLHFLENCTLAADPVDDGERWKKWEELVHHLWMLLVSYNTTMKGYLYSSVSKEISRPGSLVYKTEDMLTRTAICKSVEAFLSRSLADVGQDLPMHVEESLTYLQDFLLDACEC